MAAEKKEAFLMTADETLASYQTNLENGLNDDQVKERLEKYGKNKLEEGKKTSLIKKFLLQFKDFLILVLIVAAIISGLLEISDTLLILIIVVVNAIIGVIQENKAENAMESLKKLTIPEAEVIRNGQKQMIPSINLVPGDIVCLDAGDRIPADGRIIESAALQVQESALTGESVPVEKNADNITNPKTPLGDRLNYLFMSSVVTYGRGKYIVTGTGMETEIGNIAGMIQGTKQSQTPLQKSLAQLGKTLAIGALAACAIIFIVGIKGWRSTNDVYDSRQFGCSCYSRRASCDSYRCFSTGNAKTGCKTCHY